MKAFWLMLFVLLGVLPVYGDAVESRVAVLEARIDNICETISDLNAKVATKDDIARLEQQIADLKDLLRPTVQKADRLEVWHENHEDRFDRLDGDFKRLEMIVYGALGLGVTGAGSAEFIRRKRRNGNAGKS